MTLTRHDDVTHKSTITRSSAVNITLTLTLTVSLTRGVTCSKPYYYEYSWHKYDDDPTAGRALNVALEVSLP